MLSSGIFNRAPSLGQLLSYICQKCFDGEQDLIKEYNIAVEALGRPASFDQKRDSIVRVEAHRLRKRLRQYYGSEGRDHAVQIDLPPGGYVPVFVHPASPHLDSPPGQDTRAGATPPPVAPRIARRPSPVKWVLMASAVLALGFLAAFVFRGRNLPQPQATSLTTNQIPSRPADLAAAANVSEVRIAAGSPVSIRDAEGTPWLSDRYFRGGAAVSDPSLEVSGTLRPQLFQSWRQGDFTYDIPLKPGVYELTLFFCEPIFRSGSDNARNFRITLNGKTAISEYDIITDAGAAKTAVAHTWRDIAPASDGYLHIGLAALTNPPILSALAIVPGTAGRLRPIRIAAREEPYTDSAGRLWSPDRFFFGGKLVKRIEAIQNTEDPELYRGERYGRLTYTIPVPPDSTYTAVFHFAETWFGTPRGQGGARSRLFDILCNGVLLERNLDVFSQAGGAHRALRKTYRGLHPTPNGKLVFQLIPSANYAFLNALEVLDEGRRPTSGN